MDSKKQKVDSIDQKDKTQAKKLELQRSKSRKKEFHYLEYKQKRLRVLIRVLAFAVGILLILTAGAVFAYQRFYNNKVFEGVKLLGIDGSGKNQQELAALLTKRINDYKIIVQSESQKYNVTLKDLGYSYNIEKMIGDAYRYGREGSFFTAMREKITGVFSRYDFDLGFTKITFSAKEVKPSYKTDQKKLEKYLSDLETKINISAKDSEIKVENGKIQITPAVFGKKLKTGILKQQLVEAAASLEEKTLVIKTETVEPAIYDNSTKELAEDSEKIVSKAINLSYQDQIYSPSKSTVTSWISFERINESDPWQLIIDNLKIKTYLDVIGNQINNWPQQKIVRVENGTKETITQEGKEGLIIDTDTLAARIKTALKDSSRKVISLEIPMMIAPFDTKRDEVIVADWEKYIDINISTQFMTAYTKGGNKVGEWYITTGQSGMDTPVGTFLIISKTGANEAGVCMPNPPSSVPLCGIHYVSTFTGQGHAIHEAWWRSSCVLPTDGSSCFGSSSYVWNGSHGCINSPIEVARFIYDWAPLGTPVTTHY